MVKLKLRQQSWKCVASQRWLLILLGCCVSCKGAVNWFDSSEVVAWEKVLRRHTIPWGHEAITQLNTSRAHSLGAEQVNSTTLYLKNLTGVYGPMLSSKKQWKYLLLLSGSEWAGNWFCVGQSHMGCLRGVSNKMYSRNQCIILAVPSLPLAGVTRNS